MKPPPWNAGLSTRCRRAIARAKILSPEQLSATLQARQHVMWRNFGVGSLREVTVWLVDKGLPGAPPHFTDKNRFTRGQLTEELAKHIDAIHQLRVLALRPAAVVSLAEVEGVAEPLMKISDLPPDLKEIIVRLRGERLQ